MATKTDKYEFRKKEDNDFYDFDDYNNNFEKIETALTEFDDSGSVEGITSLPEMLAKLVTGNKLAVTLRNLKAGLQFVLHTGSIVNNCVTDNAKLPLSAAQGKVLMDMITQLNSEAAKKTAFTLPPGTKTLQFPNTYFCFLLSIQGGFGQLYADFVVTGYGDGGSSRYHVATLQCGNNINIAVGSEGARSITLANTSTNTAQCVMLNII